MTQYTITVEESWLFYALGCFLKELTNYDSPTAGTDNIAYWSNKNEK